MHEYDATYIYFNTILINSEWVYPLPSSFVDCTKVWAFFNVFTTLPTYPSPNSTSTLTLHFGQSVGLWEELVGRSQKLNWSNNLAKQSCLQFCIHNI